MKDAQKIFSSLLQQPFLTPLRVRLQLEQLKLYLPAGVLVGLRSIVMKNSKLLLVFKHPSAYAYFKGQKAYFTSTLLQAAKQLNIPTMPTEVQGYLPKRIQQDFKVEAPKLYYDERAKGDFENLFKDPELREILENIRTCIKKHHGSQGS
ncbi:hypothetical protein [Helicobacter ailurogastricus]|uniref:Uncharacterized protein n=1 Tax=Helicobacter ailurogastricus TaxID=1578720 RepID=A0A0K2X885_9HELI|nr:hypothetical protein [Helicobacter ailurogastricus]CRF40612.1 hypothetical protein HAL011_03740 [Helicobacter ailurogastricus]CRF42266.1 hypothetical protein HAL013_04330 [Helicobacter ailurogastricus]CRF44218.1 hypothetical protein HAL09_07930 [Helicobacter ailurogastricus]GLH57945.1 hypothetical protein NHP214376_07330 [Helicobacter ailurogastricus]GLH59434.1 hypothetical protein NHP214377_07010 [Helicobacter ailurogastricus]